MLVGMLAFWVLCDRSPHSHFALPYFSLPFFSRIHRSTAFQNSEDKLWLVMMAIRNPWLVSGLLLGIFCRSGLAWPLEAENAGQVEKRDNPQFSNGQPIDGKGKGASILGECEIQTGSILSQHTDTNPRWNQPPNRPAKPGQFGPATNRRRCCADP